MSATLLGQSVPPVAGVQDEHQGRRAKAKTYYDKTANRDLASFSPRQFVYTKPSDHHRGDECSYGEVLEEVTPRSYVIRTQDGLIRRNRTHIRLAEHSQQFDHQTLEKHKAKIGVGSVAEKSSEATKSMSISEGETPAESYGEVLEEVTPRSYVIRTQDGLIRRNRTHIRLAEHSQQFDHQTLEKHKAKIGVGSVAEKSSEATKSMSISEGETPAESPQMKTSLRCKRFVMVE